MIDVSFIKFAWKYFFTDFYTTVNILTSDASKNLFVNYPNGSAAFAVLKDDASIVKVLSSNTKLGYHYSIFTDIIDKENSFTNPKTDSHRINMIHEIMKESMKYTNENIGKIMDKHLYILFDMLGSGGFLDEAFEKFMLSIWLEVMFGNCVSLEEYIDIRNKVLDYLKIFYESKWKFVPIIGSITTKFNKQRYKNKLKEIDALLIKLTKSITNNATKNKGFIANLYNNGISEEIILGNAINFILIYDFIANTTLESLINIVHNCQVSHTYSYKKSYIFQYRSRVLEEDLLIENRILKKGTLVYLDLKEKYHHSHGPRMCIGIKFTHLFTTYFNHFINDACKFELLDVNPKESFVYSKDVPMDSLKYKVNISYKRDYLQKWLPSYNFKGIQFYDILSIYRNVSLFKYIVGAFTKALLASDIGVDCILVPEVRGIPLASCVASNLNLPLHIARKSGKIPGRIHSYTYSTLYSTDTLEISQHSELNNKRVVIIDDGISSGGTIKACMKLLDKFSGCNIVKVLCIIDYRRSHGISNVYTLFDIV
jgi:adenine phosphoribosyltransferase